MQLFIIWPRCFTRGERYHVYCQQNYDLCLLRMLEMQIRMHSVVAAACAQAVERVGMPEAQIILSQAVIYVACAPKSNATVNAIFSAKDVGRT